MSKMLTTKDLTNSYPSFSFSFETWASHETQLSSWNTVLNFLACSSLKQDKLFSRISRFALPLSRARYKRISTKKLGRAGWRESYPRRCGSLGFFPAFGRLGVRRFLPLSAVSRRLTVCFVHFSVLITD